MSSRTPTSARRPHGRPNAGRIASHLAVMGAVAVVMGVLIACLAIPFAGLVGVAAKDVSTNMVNLPESLEAKDLSQKTRIYDVNGNLIASLYDQNRINVPLQSISRPMVKAIVAIEDYRFYDHGALDLKGTLRAFITNQANGGSVQGGSSITQQMVKQTLLYQAETDEEKAAATEETYARKIRELRYAIAFEKNHTKDWILERYLNIAYFGDGAFGVQAAARHFFSKNANKLNLLESATLAGLVKNPVGYDPVDNPERAQNRRNVVLDRLAQLGVLSEKKAERLKAKPIEKTLDDRERRQRLPAVAGTVLLRLRRQLAAQGPGPRRHAQGASYGAQERRPHHPDHDRPRHAEGRRPVGRRARLPDRPGHRWARDGRAGHRRRARAGAVAADGQGQEGRPDLPQLRRAQEVRRRQRLPGRARPSRSSSSPPPSTRASR